MRTQDLGSGRWRIEYGPPGLMGVVITLVDPATVTEFFDQRGRLAVAGLRNADGSVLAQQLLLAPTS